MTQFSKRHKLFIFQTLLGFGVLLLWLTFLDLEKVKLYLSSVNLYFLLGAISLAILTSILRVVRLKILLLPLGRVSFVKLYLAVLAGTLVNFLIPLRAGEVAKALFLKSQKLPFTFSLSTIFFDKALDFLVMGCFLLLAPLAFASLNNLIFFRAWIFLFLFLPLGVIYLLVWQNKFCLKISGFFKKLLPQKGLISLIYKGGEDFIKGFAKIGRRPKVVFGLLSYSFLLLILSGAYFYLLFKAVGFQAPFLLIWYAAIAFTFSYLIPSAPGYLGTTEVAGTALFSLILAISKEKAASLVLLYRIVNTTLVFLVGGAAFWLLGLRFFAVLSLFFKKDKKS
jgi:uncharacterized protein (TIRG00374 family)